MQFRKIWLSLSCTSLLMAQPLYTNTAHADLTIGVFKQLEKGTKADKLGLDSYIGGVGKGYLWANANLENMGRQPLFCFKGDMTTHDFLRIASTEIKYVQRYKQMGDDTEVEIVLLEKLKRMYPCENTK